jgi:hypothetical protein
MDFLVQVHASRRLICLYFIWLSWQSNVLSGGERFPHCFIHELINCIVTRVAQICGVLIRMLYSAGLWPPLASVQFHFLSCLGKSSIAAVSPLEYVRYCFGQPSRFCFAASRPTTKLQLRIIATRAPKWVSSLDLMQQMMSFIGIGTSIFQLLRALWNCAKVICLNSRQRGKMSSVHHGLICRIRGKWTHAPCHHYRIHERFDQPVMVKFSKAFEFGQKNIRNENNEFHGTCTPDIEIPNWFARWIRSAAVRKLLVFPCWNICATEMVKWIRKSNNES